MVPSRGAWQRCQAINSDVHLGGIGSFVFIIIWHDMKWCTSHERMLFKTKMKYYSHIGRRRGESIMILLKVIVTIGERDERSRWPKPCESSISTHGFIARSYTTLLARDLSTEKSHKFPLKNFPYNPSTTFQWLRCCLWGQCELPHCPHKTFQLSSFCL